MGRGRQRKPKVSGEEKENESAEITERNWGELWFGKISTGAGNANIRTKAKNKDKTITKKMVKCHIKGNSGRCYSRSFQAWLALRMWFDTWQIETKYWHPLWQPSHLSFLMLIISTPPYVLQMEHCRKETYPGRWHHRASVYQHCSGSWRPKRKHVNRGL